MTTHPEALLEAELVQQLQGFGCISKEVRVALYRTD